MNKSILTISRNWNHPQITTKISLNDISLEIQLDDFIEAIYKELDIVTPLVAEIGAITWVFKEETFRKRLDAAFENVFKNQLDDTILKVISELKKETAKVI